MRAVICAIMTLLFVPYGYADSYALVAKDKVNVRVDSTPMSPVLGVLDVNEKVQVLEERFDWSRIVLPARFSCFVSSEFVNESDIKKIEVTADNVNLRNEPSRMAFVIGKARKGDILFVLEKLDGWHKVVAYPYSSGWVHSNFLHAIKVPVNNEGVVTK